MTHPRIAAIVLAAGEGRRLLPLTRAVPKPLLTVLDTPLIDLIIARIRDVQPCHLYVGLHYRADDLAEHIGRVWGSSIACRAEASLSGPAGALRQFADDVADADVVLVVSGDVVFSAPLAQLVQTHLVTKARMTFAGVRTTGARHFGVLDVDETNAVRGTREKPPVPDQEEHWISAGIYCLEPSLLSSIPADRTFDFAADLAPELLVAGQRVQMYRLPGYWNDVGNPAALKLVNLRAASGLIPGIDASSPEVRSARQPALGPYIHIGEDVTIGRGVTIKGPAVIGAGSVLGDGSSIESSVLLPGSTVSSGTGLFEALVAALPMGIL